MRPISKALLITILATSLSVSAEIGLKFNFMGEFVPPDKILFDRGVKDYKKGDLKSSMNHFKRAAKFGNEMSKYLIARMYLEEKDWTTAYAWLNMVHEPIDKRDYLLKTLGSQFSEEEQKKSDHKLTQLKQDYGRLNVYDRRIKWQKAIRLTGTNIPGIRSLDSRRLLIDPGGLDGGLLGKNTSDAGATSGVTSGTSHVITNGKGLRSSLVNYVLEYMPQGTVHMGEIIEKEE